MTLSTGGDGSVIDGFVVGDGVQVTYAQDSSNGVLTAQEVQYTSSREAGQATGTVTAVAGDGSSFTIQRSPAQMTVIDALTAAANNIDQGDHPYVYGGGHEQVGVPSTGIIGQGNGANGINVGYDCSGAVAAVLAAAQWGDAARIERADTTSNVGGRLTWRGLPSLGVVEKRQRCRAPTGSRCGGTPARIRAR